MGNGIETKRKTFGDIEIEVTQHAYFRAQRLFMRLLKLAGPGLLGLMQIAGISGKDAALRELLDADVEKLAPAMGAFFAQLDPAIMETITCEILDGARGSVNGQMVALVENGRPKMLDIVVGGDFWTGLLMQGWALSVHFGNFKSARAAFGAAAGQLSPQ